MKVTVKTSPRGVGALHMRSWSMRVAAVSATAVGRVPDDVAREIRITALGQLMCAAPTRALRARCCYLMRQEIARRSAAQVRLMEEAAGLAGRV
ncbi:hypothetical protein K6W16_10465 [Burkholderia dolosa]|uniref:Uncharacterized protein n=1 Tax=Burkholderia dolosa TaxID=152500 RepID=A0A892I479_9BURK|nr:MULTISPECIES: hypothetical protein [Burkholderia]AKE03027.1 hypothetical protein XM57_08775 [Burkholderia cepacia]AJY14117.1 hypothetical protein AK34_710 [Burkholderia dolosa AU0158]AYZ97779.1 hypothetical protein EGY28_22730 [Burkholderia dolosa]ETP64852.1 hypothetical protein BDSB_05425 [Burkholderia dolosa PC543]MBR8419819.1 hypothetical protein [Burkholderia dolosa]